MKKSYLILLLIACFHLSAVAQISKKEAREQKREQQYQELLELVDAQQFAFRGNKANPQGGRQIDLATRQNYLRINKSNASADMPFFGRAFSAGYSTTDGGIKFDGPMQAYEVIKNDKKRRVTIKFQVKEVDDAFTCTLSLSGMNSATLSVSSTKRQNISYTGSISELPQDEVKN